MNLASSREDLANVWDSSDTPLQQNAPLSAPAPFGIHTKGEELNQRPSAILGPVGGAKFAGGAVYRIFAAPMPLQLFRDGCRAFCTSLGTCTSQLCTLCHLPPPPLPLAALPTQMAASPAQPALWQRLLPPWGTPARSQAGSRSSRGGAPAVALTAATCAAAPLLPGIPEDRPSRRKRLFCFGLLASLVVGVGVASVVLGSQHNSSAAVASSDSAAAAGAAAAGDQGGGTSSGGTSSGSSTEQSGGGGGEGEEAGGEGSGGQGGEQEGSTESEGGIDEGGDDGGGGGQEAAAPAASEQGLAEGGGVPAPTTEWAGASPWDGSGSDAWDSGEEEEEGKGEAPATEKGEGEAGAAPSEEGSTAGGKAGYTLRFLAVSTALQACGCAALLA